jgi:hypothetical protein
MLQTLGVLCVLPSICERLTSSLAILLYYSVVVVVGQRLSPPDAMGVIPPRIGLTRVDELRGCYQFFLCR